MPTYPLATLAPTIDQYGITAPTYNDIYQSLIASFQSIYGSDIYISPDSQDGQWLAVLAQAQHDSNQAAIAVYQSQSPSYAQGAGLSSLVKINGLTRQIATNSTAVGNVVGTVGTIVTNGVVEDANGNLWNLPASVTIPSLGTIAVTVTAQNQGAIFAVSGTINKIYNPQLGWQSFTSTSDAVPGAAVETDAALRARQSSSVALPALGIKESIFSSIGNVSGVQRWTVYENPTATTDVNGVPAHSFDVIVEGGTVTDIATTIAARKPPGIQTYGGTSYTVYDALGLPVVINFDVLGVVQTYYNITIKALGGYVGTYAADIQNAVTAFINSLGIGEDVYVPQVSAVASLINLPEGQTFKVTSVALGTAPSPVGASDIAIAFNQAASVLPANITITVT